MTRFPNAERVAAAREELAILADRMERYVVELEKLRQKRLRVKASLRALASGRTPPRTHHASRNRARELDVVQDEDLTAAEARAVARRKDEKAARLTEISTQPGQVALPAARPRRPTAPELLADLTARGEVPRRRRRA